MLYTSQLHVVHSDIGKCLWLGVGTYTCYPALGRQEEYIKFEVD